MAATAAAATTAEACTSLVSLRHHFRVLASAAPVLGAPPALEARRRSRGGSATAAAVALAATCNLCCPGTQFPDAAEQREHFKSDWHRLNLKRASKGKEPLPLERAQELFAGSHREDELESISASSSSAAETTEEEDDERAAEGELDRVGQGRNPHKGYVVFRLRMEPGELKKLLGATASLAAADDGVYCRIHGAVVSNMKELLELESKMASFTWLVLMFGGGHFAGAIFRDGQLGTEHKTIHRYTVRRKQGGAQSSQDATGRKPKSAGSMLRRYNEQMLGQEVGEFVKSIQKQIASECDRIFIACTQRMRGVFFQDPKALANTDPRIRYIPFTTGRPTLKEAKRVVDLLSTVWLSLDLAVLSPTSIAPSQPDSEASAEKNQQVEKPLDAASTDSTTALSVKTEESDLASKIFFERTIHQLVRQGTSVGELENLITSFAEDTKGLEVNAQSENGETALLLAAEKGDAELIKLLLNHGANPGTRDFRGRYPFLVCSDKKTRNVFREYRGLHPDQWDYHNANIPEALTEEVERERKEKEKQKKKRQAQARKEKKQQEEDVARERKQREEEEARAKAEAAQKLDLCAQCRGLLPDKKKDRFHTGGCVFCSSSCQQAHRRQLAAEAAERRMQAAAAQAATR